MNLQKEPKQRKFSSLETLAAFLSCNKIAQKPSLQLGTTFALL